MDKFTKNKGKAKSDEHKNAISKACSGLPKRKNNAHSKSVTQYDCNYNYCKEYPSVMEAYRQTGISQSNISACCNGRIYSAGGYFWSF